MARKGLAASVLEGLSRTLDRPGPSRRGNLPRSALGSNLDVSIWTHSSSAGDAMRIHVEFQTRADRGLGLRMLRTFSALGGLFGSPPEQHAVWLHPDGDSLAIGTVGPLCYQPGRRNLGLGACCS